jgi:hypothetical protein
MIKDAFLAIAAVVLLACDGNPFGPVYNACAKEMEVVRTSYPGTPSQEQRVRLSDGRPAVVWSIAPQPGALTPRGIAFMGAGLLAASCNVCWPADLCWTDEILPVL